MLGQGTDYIALRTGLRRRVIQWHKQGRCSCPEKEALPDSGEKRVPDFARMTAEEAIQELYRCGMPVQMIAEYVGVPEGEIIITPESRQELVRREGVALARVAEESPSRWLAMMAERKAQEEAAGDRAKVDPELVTAFTTDLIRKERTLLPVSEFPDWLTWLRELFEARYPELSGMLDSAISGEQQQHESLVVGVVSE